MGRLWRLEVLTYWLQPAKPDLGEWYWFDVLVEVTIFVEVFVALAIYAFLARHGAL